MNRRLAAAIVSFALVLVACGSSDGSSAKPSGAGATTSTAVDQPAASPEERLEDAQTGLAKGIDRLTWPEAYTPTVAGLTPMLGDPEEWLMTERDGLDIADAWNLCAWLREGVDRIGAGASPEQLEEPAERVEVWAAEAPDAVAMFEDIVDGLRTGDPAPANQYIEANSCRDFPS